MAISEDDRYELHQALIDCIGRQQAATLMASIPPTGWADVATKHDLDALRAATKHDLDALRAATKHDLDALRAATKHDLDALRDELLALEARFELRLRASEDRLRTEMADLRTEVRTEMADVRTEMADVRTEMAALRTEVRTEMAGLRVELADRLRTQMQVMVASLAAFAGAVIAAVRL